jgi:hypothetical protein
VGSTGAFPGVGQNDEVAVEVAEPDLTMPSVGVEMYVGLDDDVTLLDPIDRGIERVQLEPDGDAVAEGKSGIPDGAVVACQGDQGRTRA